MRIFLFILLNAVLLAACEDKLVSEKQFYFYDFSSNDENKFSNLRLLNFNGVPVAGNYHNEELTLTLSNLSDHNILKLTVEILIHDSWDGNQNIPIAGPDFWYITVDGEEVLRTTFSNSPCESTYCLRQSYPQDYFRQNFPKAGAIQTNLPGLCLFGNRSNYTTKYRISKLISHNKSGVTVVFGDELKALNSPDPRCDESWSVSKVEVIGMIVN